MRTPSFFAWAAAASLCLAACAAPEAEPEAATLRIVTRSPVLSADPQTEIDSLTLSVLASVYEPLVRLDARLRPVPALATSWTSPSEETWRFELREDVHFHDGRRFGPEDLRHTLKRAREHPDSWVRTVLRPVEAVNVVDARTVEIRTREPAPLLLNGLSEVLVLPAGFDPGREQRAVGTGPYRLVSRNASETVLEGFGAHHAGPPAWQRVVLRAEADGHARLAAVLTGRADLADFPPLEGLGRLRETPGAQVLEFPGWSLTLFGFRVDRPEDPFSRPAARRALDLALDRRALVLEALDGLGRPATQLAPPGVFGYDPERAPPAFDLAAARAALEEAGLGSGFEAEVSFTERDRRIVDFVVDAAAQLGVRLQRRELLWPELDRRMDAREAPLYVFQMTFPTGDALDLLLDGFHSRYPDRSFGLLNFSGHADPELDLLIEEATHERQPARRLATLQRAMQLALASRAWLPLCLPSHVFAASDGLQWEGNSAGRLKIHEIRRAKAAR